MLIQIIIAFFGLSTTINATEGLLSREERHWQNIMATEQQAVQFQTRFIEKASETGLFDKEECATMIREIKEGGKKSSLVVQSTKFGHWLREKIISYQNRHLEIADAFEKTKLVVKILQDTLNHIEEEKKLNQTEKEREEASEYELVDEEIIQLEIEKQEWELLLKNLRDKLANLAQHRN